MYRLLRPLLFRFDPENIHSYTLRALAVAAATRFGRNRLSQAFGYSDPRLETEVMGLQFRNPIGLAAGFDKDGMAIPGLAALGFGHVEIGTVTNKSQPGNDRPRIFRVPEKTALINSMGFPSAGVASLLPRLQAARKSVNGVVVGVNIGKNRDTPLEAAIEDYVACLRVIAGAADYITVNVSSPNTPNLRMLQHRASLEPMLRELNRVRDEVAPGLPILVKIAPDLSFDEIDDILDVLDASHIAGIIATNAMNSAAPYPPGGLSGPPLRDTATCIVRHIAAQTGGRLPIISLGGVHDVESALEKLRAGASLVQVFTGLIYEGPALAKRITEGIVKLMEVKGINSIEELVGN